MDSVMKPTTTDNNALPRKSSNDKSITANQGGPKRGISCHNSHIGKPFTDSKTNTMGAKTS